MPIPPQLRNTVMISLYGTCVNKKTKKSSKKLNYISEHYVAIARKSHIFKDEHIMDRAKENLEIIGKVYGYE